MEQENREQVSAFIVKVWREETADRTEQIRGLIIHIPSGNRRTITHLQEIPAFIEPFLDQQRDPFTGR